MNRDSNTIRAKLEGIFTEYENAILVFLFGSYAGDHVTPLSDLDIAVYFHDSPDMYELNEIKGKIEGTLHKDADIVNLNEASPVISMQVLKKGILLFNRDARVYNKFFVNTVKAYDDLKQNRKEIEDNILKGRIYA